MRWWFQIIFQELFIMVAVYTFILPCEITRDHYHYHHPVSFRPYVPTPNQLELSCNNCELSWSGTGRIDCKENGSHPFQSHPNIHSYFHFISSSNQVLLTPTHFQNVGYRYYITYCVGLGCERESKGHTLWWYSESNHTRRISRVNPFNR